MTTGFHHPMDPIGKLRQQLRQFFPNEATRRQVLKMCHRVMKPHSDRRLYVFCGRGGNGKTRFLWHLEQMLGSHLFKMSAQQLCDTLPMMINQPTFDRLKQTKIVAIDGCEKDVFTRSIPLMEASFSYHYQYDNHCRWFEPHFDLVVCVNHDPYGVEMYGGLERVVEIIRFESDGPFELDADLFRSVLNDQNDQLYLTLV
jgi:hypothetical protein